MNTIQLVNMNATEIFRQQVTSAMEGIRYQNSGGTKTYLPLQMGGIFMQREMLEGGHVVRITKIVGDTNG
jgi:hypothetical protein